MKRNPDDADMQMIAKWKKTGEQPLAQELADLLLGSFASITKTTASLGRRFQCGWSC